MTELVDGQAFSDAGAQLKRAAGPVVDRRTASALDELAELEAEAIRRRRARHRRTGKGERLVSVHATGAGTGTVVRVHAGGRVAHLLTGGTRAHVIRPHRADAIPLRAAARGFAAVVHHPGTRPDPFVAKGIDDARGEVGRVVDDAARAIARDVAHELGR